jgi:ATP-binding cassette subfamily C (CFTR/MRP) protein 1
MLLRASEREVRTRQEIAVDSVHVMLASLSQISPRSHCYTAAMSDLKAQASVGSVPLRATDVDSQPKSKLQPQSPELHANALSRLVWWWMNGLMARGMARPLNEEDIYELKPELEASALASPFEKAWREEIQMAKERKTAKEAAAAAAEPAQPSQEAGKAVQLSPMAPEQKPAVAKLESKPAADKPAGKGDAAAQLPPRTPEDPSLAAALFRLHASGFWLGALCKSLSDGLGLLQPILLQYLLSYLVDREFYSYLNIAQPPQWHGIVLAVAMGVCPFLAGLLENRHQQLMTLTGFRIRSVLVQAMYRKSLLLSPRARAQYSTGKIVSSMSSDTYLLDMFLGYCHLSWSAVVQIIIALALLIRAIGWPAVVGFSVIVVITPISGIIMLKWFGSYAAQSPIKDQRVKLIHEILQGIRVIKLYVWEGSFLRKLEEIRGRELDIIRLQQLLNVWSTMMWTATPVLISLVAFVTLGLTSSTFDPAKVFAALALFNLLRMPLVMMPLVMAQGTSALVALRRIEAFLLADELSWSPTLVPAGDLQDDAGRTLAVRMQDACFEWDAPTPVEDDKKPPLANSGENPNKINQQAESKQADASKPPDTPASTIGAPAPSLSSVPQPPQPGFKLSDLNLAIDSGSLVCVVGGVGSGKSSLLSALLGRR